MLVFVSLFACFCTAMCKNYDSGQKEVPPLPSYAKWYDWLISKRDTFITSKGEVHKIVYDYDNITDAQMSGYPKTPKTFRISCYEWGDTTLIYADVFFYGENSLMLACDMPDKVSIRNLLEPVNDDFNTLLNIWQSDKSLPGLRDYGRNAVGSKEPWHAIFSKKSIDGKITLTNDNDSSMMVEVDYYEPYRRFELSENRHPRERITVGDSLLTTAPPFIFIAYEQYASLFSNNTFLDYEDKTSSSFIRMRYFYPLEK